MCNYALKIHSYALELGKWTCMLMKHQLFKSRAHFLCLDGLALDYLYLGKTYRVESLDCNTYNAIGSLFLIFKVCQWLLVLHLELWKLIRMNCLMMLHGVGVWMNKWGTYFISWINNFHDKKHLDFYVFVLSRMHYKIYICTLSFKLNIKRNMWKD
jgi:hypothetical protein